MLARDWPFLDSYRKEVEACLQGDCRGVEEAIGELKTSQALSLLSPHLLDTSQAPQPFALIPFCAYQGDLEFFGKENSNSSLPVCSQFKPRVLLDKLCYTLNMKGLTSKPRAQHGLQIMIDPVHTTPGLQLEGSSTEVEKTKLARKVDNTGSTKQAEVYAPTLASFRARGGGMFALSALKVMGGTNAFLHKMIQLKSAACKAMIMRNVIQKRAEEACWCLPWSLSPALASPPPTFCSPASMACYTRLAEQAVLHRPLC